jgi:hypothetical protein
VSHSNPTDSERLRIARRMAERIAAMRRENAETAEWHRQFFGGDLEALERLTERYPVLKEMSES